MTGLEISMQVAIAWPAAFAIPLSMSSSSNALDCSWVNTTDIDDVAKHTTIRRELVLKEADAYIMLLSSASLFCPRPFSVLYEDRGLAPRERENA